MTAKELREKLKDIPDECKVMIGADCAVYYADHAEIEHDGFWIYGE